MNYFHFPDFGKQIENFKKLIVLTWKKRWRGEQNWGNYSFYNVLAGAPAPPNKAKKGKNSPLRRFVNKIN